MKYRWTRRNTIFADSDGVITQFAKNQEVDLTKEEESYFRGQILRGHFVLVEKPTPDPVPEATTTTSTNDDAGDI